LLEAAIGSSRAFVFGEAGLWASDLQEIRVRGLALAGGGRSPLPRPGGHLPSCCAAGALPHRRPQRAHRLQGERTAGHISLGVTSFKFGSFRVWGPNTARQHYVSIHAGWDRRAYNHVHCSLAWDCETLKTENNCDPCCQRCSARGTLLSRVCDPPPQPPPRGCRRRWPR
jgi:hypothetical protein